MCKLGQKLQVVLACRSHVRVHSTVGLWQQGCDAVHDLVEHPLSDLLIHSFPCGCQLEGLADLDMKIGAPEARPITSVLLGAMVSNSQDRRSASQSNEDDTRVTSLKAAVSTAGAHWANSKYLVRFQFR